MDIQICLSALRARGGKEQRFSESLSGLNFITRSGKKMKTARCSTPTMTAVLNPMDKLSWSSYAASAGCVQTSHLSRDMVLDTCSALRPDTCFVVFPAIKHEALFTTIILKVHFLPVSWLDSVLSCPDQASAHLSEFIVIVLKGESSELGAVPVFIVFWFGSTHLQAKHCNCSIILYY